MPHYHIHWSGKDGLDWESHASRADAEASARRLVRLGETYTIEEQDEACPRCRRAAFKSKTEHVTQETYRDPNLKYPWQQAVSDAFKEPRSENLPVKFSVAQRAIAARLRDHTAPPKLDEQLAIRDALRSLSVLCPEPTTKESDQKEEFDEKKRSA
jgi:hypothetical protein